MIKKNWGHWLEKTARFEISNSQGKQNTVIATDRCSAEIAIWQKKTFLRCKSPGYVVQILSSKNKFERVQF